MAGGGASESRRQQRAVCAGMSVERRRRLGGGAAIVFALEGATGTVPGIGSRREPGGFVLDSEKEVSRDVLRHVRL